MSENSNRSRNRPRRTSGRKRISQVRNTPVAQRLATAIGAVLVALVCLVALPAHASAATVSWSDRKPVAQYCYPEGDHRGWQVITLAHGYAKIRQCLGVSRSASGTAYYQGVLELRYNHVGSIGSGDVLGAKSILARTGGTTLGVNDCRPVRFANDTTNWCYSPSKVRPSDQRFYGKGILVNSTGGWYHPLVWSPVIPEAPGCRTAVSC